MKTRTELAAVVIPYAAAIVCIALRHDILAVALLFVALVLGAVLNRVRRAQALFAALLSSVEPRHAADPYQRKDRT